MATCKLLHIVQRSICLGESLWNVSLFARSIDQSDSTLWVYTVPRTYFPAEWCGCESTIRSGKKTCKENGAP